MVLGPMRARTGPGTLLRSVMLSRVLRGLRACFSMTANLRCAAPGNKVLIVSSGSGRLQHQFAYQLRHLFATITPSYHPPPFCWHHLALMLPGESPFAT